MEPRRPPRLPHPLVFVGWFAFFGSIALSKFTNGRVRTVDSLGLFSSGLGCGVSVSGFAHALRARRKP